MTAQLIFVFLAASIAIMILIRLAKSRCSRSMKRSEFPDVGRSYPGWMMSMSQDASAALHGADTPGMFGKRTLLLRGRGAWISANAPPMEIDPAKTYRASASIKVAKGHVHIQISYWSAGKWLGATDGAERLVEDAWRQVSVRSEPGKFPGVTHLNMAIVSDGPDVEVYTDDAALAEA